MDSQRVVRAHCNGHLELSAVALLHTEASEHASLLQDEEKVESSWEGLGSEGHDAESEVHALRGCTVWRRKTEGGVEI